MQFELDPLPYEQNALEPHISARTLEFHYGKHHQGYMTKLKNAVEGTPDADKDLVSLIRQAEDQNVFNNAAQVWNHTFQWNSMHPDGGGDPPAALKKELEKHFETVDEFKKTFAGAAKGRFGSGWAWLVKAADGSLQVKSTLNADTPLAGNDIPLLTLDVWEHAYYLDWQNDRPGYVEAFVEHLINWNFIEANLERGA